MTDSPEHRDTLYRQALDSVPAFVFDESVVQVFPDMINRSVPGYGSVLAVTAVLAGRYSRPGTRIYDLGCSLGAASLAVAQAAVAGSEIIAVDNSPAMIERLERNLAECGQLANPIETHCADIMDVPIENASLVVMNYTLQFLALEQRAALLEKIAAGLLPGGALVLAEKVAMPDAELNQLFIDLHHDFKRRNGYSELEISQKRDALENVLVPESIEQHRQRLLAAGFSQVDCWSQCLNFCALLAVK